MSLIKSIILSLTRNIVQYFQVAGFSFLASDWQFVLIESGRFFTPVANSH